MIAVNHWDRQTELRQSDQSLVVVYGQGRRSDDDNDKPGHSSKDLVLTRHSVHPVQVLGHWIQLGGYTQAIVIYIARHCTELFHVFDTPCCRQPTQKVSADHYHRQHALFSIEYVPPYTICHSLDVSRSVRLMLVSRVIDCLDLLA